MTRFHGLLLIRDEEDVIEENIRSNLEWADSLWIIDTGSTDATWEIVEKIATEDPRVRPVAKRDLLFGQHLRSYLFHRARSFFDDGDWVVKLDADEFYEIRPPEFVDRFVASEEGCVYLQWIYFRITTSEAAAYEGGKIDIKVERHQPIAMRRRYYKVTDHTEPRMFRYRTSMKFAETDSFPRFAGLVARRLIPVRHYPHRDPVQLQRRYELRALMKRMGSKASNHWNQSDWRADLVNSSNDECNNPTIVAGSLASEMGHDDGPLLYWAPGETLPSTLDRIYEEQEAKRVLKKIFYRYCVRIADSLVKGFEDNAFLDRNRLPSVQETTPR